METSKALPQKQHCCIQSCRNFKGTTNEKFHFFKPSMERHILEKWKEAISPHQEVKNITFVCNLHFEPQSIIEMDGQLFLKHGSIPSIFASSPPPESASQVEQLIVKVEPLPVVDSNTVHLVNVDQIIQNASTHNESDERIDNVGLAQCNGCHKRDSKIQSLLANIERLKKSQEQKRKLICYWKSLAVFNTKRGRKETVVVKIDQLRQKSKRNPPKKRIKSIETAPEISTKSIKVEGRPIKAMDVKELNTSIEPETVLIEMAEGEKIKRADMSLKKSSEELQNCLLKPYKCGKCGELFERPIELSRHLIAHRVAHKEGVPFMSINKVYECHICKKEFKMRSKIQKHMRVHVEKRKKCAVCQLQGATDQHLCIQEECISCEHCPQKFISTTDLLQHLERTHNEKKLHKCLKCNSYFRMMFLKIIHERSHDVIEPFVCNVCTKSFTIQDSLINHQKRCSPGNREESKKQSHLCDQCGKKFNSAPNLANHMLWHSEPTIKCPDCPQLFHTRHNLKRHSYIHRNDIFVCAICGVELSSPFNMRKHMRDVHQSQKNKSYKCEICGKSIRTLKNFKKHIEAHARGKIFRCSFCDSAYKYKGDLNKHMRTHLGDKIYECKECDKRFRVPIELKKHSFEHYKERQMAANTTEE